MNSSTVECLLALNRDFYHNFGDAFSATRQRLQPGVRKVLETIHADDSVLDLGCGNGNFLLTLSQRSHQATLLGLDFSSPLLRAAGSTPGVSFLEADLSQLSMNTNPQLIGRKWDVITMFAALHHIPANEIRVDILRTVCNLLNEGGRFVLSNWQFLNSEKLKARIQPWSKVNLSDKDVEAGDYLLDWRRGGKGLRYVHHFSAEELFRLAGQVGLRVSASFLSDGENSKLGLYQTWLAI